MPSRSVAGRMIRVAVPRQPEGFGGALPEPELRRPPFRADLVEAEPVGSVSRDDDEIDTVGQEGRPQPKTLAAESLDAVAPDSPRDAPANHEPEARSSPSLLRRDEKREVGRSHAPARALGAGELPMVPQPLVAPEAERHYFL